MVSQTPFSWTWTSQGVVIIKHDKITLEADAHDDGRRRRIRQVLDVFAVQYLRSVLVTNVH